MALLILRAAPVDHHLPSPAELLYSRLPESNLPAKVPNRHPENEAVVTRLQQRQSDQKYYHDQKAGTELPSLVPGQTVGIQDHNRRWSPAVVQNIRSEPRSYDVETGNGSLLRRNRHQLRELPTPQPAGTATYEPPPPKTKRMHFDEDISFHQWACERTMDGTTVIPVTTSLTQCVTVKPPTQLVQGGKSKHLSVSTSRTTHSIGVWADCRSLL